MDATLPADLQRVGRWFCISLVLSSAFRFDDLPVLQPPFVIALAWSLRRLERGGPPDGPRPRTTVAIAAACVSCAASFVPLIPGGSDRIMLWSAGVSTVSILVGVSVYLNGLLAFVRASGRPVTDRMREGRRRWWLASAGTLVVLIAWMVTAEPVDDGTTSASFGSARAWTSPGLVSWLILPMILLIIHGLYRVADVHWTVLAGAERANPMPARAEPRRLADSTSTQRAQPCEGSYDDTRRHLK